MYWHLCWWSFRISWSQDNMQCWATARIACGPNRCTAIYIRIALHVWCYSVYQEHWTLNTSSADQLYVTLYSSCHCNVLPVHVLIYRVLCWLLVNAWEQEFRVEADRYVSYTCSMQRLYLCCMVCGCVPVVHTIMYMAVLAKFLTYTILLYVTI